MVEAIVEQILGAIRELPLAPLLLGVWLAALGTQLVLLRLALVQRRRELAAAEAAAQGRWAELAELAPGRTRPWEIAAAIAPVLLAVAGGIATGQARALTGAALATDAPAERATLISKAISGQLNALAFGAGSLLLVSTLATVALSIAVATRMRLAGLREAAALAERGHAAEASARAAAPGPRLALVYSSAMLFTGMGVAPLLVGVVRYCTTLIQTLASMAGTSPEAKTLAFDRALTIARIVLDSAYHASLLGLALATAAIGVLWSVGRPQRGGAARSRTAALVAGAVVIAAALHGLGRPLRAENVVPWAPMDATGEILFSPVPTPRLRGPDPVHRAPVLVVTPAATELDGQDITLDDLGGMLGTLATNTRLLNPGAPFSGEVVVVCTPETPALRVRAHLHEALLVGYEHPVFAFVERTRIHRPMFGDIARVATTGARVTAVDLDEDAMGLHGAAQPAAGTVRLDLSSFRTCGELTARIVDERRRGRDVEADVHVPAAGARTP